jgi:TetR/AcrR family transcriptional regulator
MKRPQAQNKEALAATRDPERTRERILAAALQEFSAHGFHGARVDAIARRANINKRMLYHYFGNKQNLFRAILRRKMAERSAWLAAAPKGPLDILPYWFQLACHDIDWVRLLTWEALQVGQGKVIDEKERLAAIERGLDRLRVGQSKGLLSREIDPRMLLLAISALTTLPLAFPQITRMVTGHSIEDPKFQKKWIAFLRWFTRAFGAASKGKLS